MYERGQDLRLTRGQREFAEHMRCEPTVRCGDSAVGFYRVLEDETVRWIVDASGAVLDWTVFSGGRRAR